MHPDIVGVRFPFEHYNEHTLKLLGVMRESSCTVFSFELKKEISPSNLRQYYFQAVSNSSWANEGYLVAGKISPDQDLHDDLRRLVNSFGIGVIQLNISHIEQSEVLYPARRRDVLDWEVVDYIADINSDFKNFIDDIEDDNKVGKIRGGYDSTISPEDYEDYLVEHHFPTKGSD